MLSLGPTKKITLVVFLSLIRLATRVMGYLDTKETATDDRRQKY
jgi:hypothetical protein